MRLAEVFKPFQNVSLKKGKFEIHPALYVSAPQMAWDALFMKTCVELDLITDPAMYRMIDSGMRCGVCMICKMYAKAKSPALGPLYDTQQPNSYILYLDANKLYCWAIPSLDGRICRTPPSEGCYTGSEDWRPGIAGCLCKPDACPRLWSNTFPSLAQSPRYPPHRSC